MLQLGVLAQSSTRACISYCDTMVHILQQEPAVLLPSQDTSLYRHHDMDAAWAKTPQQGTGAHDSWIDSHRGQQGGTHVWDWAQH